MLQLVLVVVVVWWEPKLIHITFYSSSRKSK